jgi:hypothetical protein
MGERDEGLGIRGFVLDRFTGEYGGRGRADPAGAGTAKASHLSGRAELAIWLRQICSGPSGQIVRRLPAQGLGLHAGGATHPIEPAEGRAHSKRSTALPSPSVHGRCYAGAAPPRDIVRPRIRHVRSSEDAGPFVWTPLCALPKMLAIGGRRGAG